MIAHVLEYGLVHETEEAAVLCEYVLGLGEVLTVVYSGTCVVQKSYAFGGELTGGGPSRLGLGLGLGKLGVSPISLALA